MAFNVGEFMYRIIIILKDLANKLYEVINYQVNIKFVTKILDFFNVTIELPEQISLLSIIGSISAVTLVVIIIYNIFKLWGLYASYNRRFDENTWNYQYTIFIRCYWAYFGLSCFVEVMEMIFNYIEMIMQARCNLVKHIQQIIVEAFFDVWYYL